MIQTVHTERRWQLGQVVRYQGEDWAIRQINTDTDGNTYELCLEPLSQSSTRRTWARTYLVRPVMRVA